ncbi:Smad nuclear-interacting protein 1, partial [Chaetura pelagica]
QEREDHCRRGNEERKQRHSSEQEHRRERSGDRDRHRDHSDRRKNPNERAGARGQERDRDAQNLREQQAEREFYNERRREHRQSAEGSGAEQHAELGPPDSKPRDKAAASKEKPSFELSGALLEDTNTFRGVVIKYSEPPEARVPKTRWRLYPFKNDEFLPVMYIHRQSAYLLGRHRRIADIPIDHPSCSKQHAVFQYRLVEYTRADGSVGRRVRPYIIDLGSGNG